MTKKELKSIENNKLIVESIRTFGFLLTNEITERGTKQLEKHFQDCCEEMCKRNLITKDDWNNLNK